MSRELVNKHMVDRHNKEVAEYWKQEEAKRRQQIRGNRQSAFDRTTWKFTSGAPSSTEQAEMLLTGARIREAEAKRELEGYKASETRGSDWEKAQKEARAAVNPWAGNVDLQIRNLERSTVNQKEQGRELASAYFTQNRKTAEDNLTMARDLEKMEAMSPEDRKLLETYAYGRDEWFDHKVIGEAVAARAELEKKYGKEAVEELAESWKRYQNARAAQKNREQTMRESQGVGGAIGHSAASVAANTLGTFTAPLGYLQEAMGRTGRYQTLDPNNAGAMAGQYAAAVRQGVSEAIEGENPGFGRKAASMLYQGTMSAADNGARILLGMGTGVNPLGLAALGSFGSTLSEASADGAKPGEAVLLGVANAGLEAATEKLSLDELFEVGKNGWQGAKAAFRQLLKQAAVEATEEEISYLGSLAAEAAILRENSGYNQQIGELVANGMSYQEAKAQADRAVWDQAVNTAIQSAISGGVMSGAQSAGQYMMNRGSAGGTRQSAPEAFRQEVPTAVPEAKPAQERAKPEPEYREEIRLPRENAPTPQEHRKPAQAREAFDENAPLTREERALLAELTRGGEDTQSRPQTIQAKAETARRGEDPEFGALSREEQSALMAELGVKSTQSAGERDIFQEASNELLGVPAQKNTAQKSENESAGIKQQIQASQETLASMEPVAQISTPKEFAGMNIAEKMKWVIEKLRPTNYQVDRKGFGIINFSAKQIKQAFKYFPKGGAEEASFEAIPYVLENGTKISTHENHKGREYSTVTFAAPVTINGKRGNMAVVVKQTTDNRYKIHRVFSPDGSVFDLSETTIEAEPTPGGGVTENGSLATPISSASDNIIPGNRADVNGENAPQGAPEGFEAMGAASAGFSPYTDLQIEYGNIPEGENPVRPDDAPISTDGTDRVSYTARTTIGAQVTPDEFVPLIEREVVRGGFSFIPITNDQTVQNAVQTIQAEGWQTARANWTAQVRQGGTGADITATGALLYNHAVNSGNFREAMDILLDYQQAVRNSAQGLQAARILKRLTPENRLYMIRRCIQRMVEDMHLNREITIDADLARRYQETTDDAEADRILDEIARDVARQIPSTAAERFTALRYLSMLGNFRTQVRNWVGNVTNEGLYLAKDELAATLEALASFVSGGRFRRSKSTVRDRTTRRAAAADYENVADWISGGGRTNDRGTESDDFARRVQENRRMFRNPLLEGYRRATDWAMNNRFFGDAAFGRANYARALAGYLNARGIRTGDLSTVDPETLNAAREYAVRQAQEATFRDSNQVSTFVSQALRGRNTPAWARVIGEAIMPFRKTPANVLVRAEEFSPLGLINSAVNTVRAARGDISGAELVDSWAKSLTGTGLFAIGWALANMGYLRGGPDEDEEKAEFDKLNGYQDYALVLPDGTNLTIDAFSPTALPLLLGAQLDKVLDGSDLTFADLEGVFHTLSDPMIEMSMLSGLKDALDGVRYADNGLAQFLVNAGFNYLTQALGNTLLGQLERSTEDSRMTTYIDKNSNIPVWLQRNLGKLSQKIPGIDFQQTAYIDQWGREQKNPQGIANWLYNLLSPSYIDKGNVDKVAQELYRLNEAQTGTNVFPQSPETTISYTDTDGKRIDKYNLTMEEADRLKRTEGQTQAKLVADLIGGADYEALTDAQKAKAVSLAYDYAREFARGEVLPGYDGMDSWMEGIQGNESGAIIRKVAASEMTDAFDAITKAWREGYSDDSKARESLENGFSVFDGLTPAMQEAIAQDSTGRLKGYLAAKEKGMETETFIDLYRQYWDIGETEKTASAKANDWAYVLERAQESRTITPAQKEALKQTLTISSGFSVAAEKFDQLTEVGLSADEAQDLGWLVRGLEIQEGYKDVRDIQKAEAIGNMRGLSESDRIAALRIYGTDAQDENLDQMLNLGYSAKDYVAAWQMYTNASGEGKKRRTIQAYMDKFGVDWDTAAAIYDIYG